MLFVIGAVIAHMMHLVSTTPAQRAAEDAYLLGEIERQVQALLALA